MAVALRDIVRNNVKEKLARDEVVSSMTVRLVRNIEIARIAQTSGFDTLYVDAEHNTFSMDSVSQVCIAAVEAGITPFVRVPSYEPEWVSRVLDGGAMGVIAPHVNSVEDARRVVRNARFPPYGERSAGGPLPQYHFRSFPVAEANEVMNEVTTVLAMMETRQALDRVEQIAAVEGVDLIFIGTNDLCCDLGIAGQYDHKLVFEAYGRAIAACKASGKHLGIGGLAGRPDLIAEFVRQGARYVSTGSDLSFLLEIAAQKAKITRDLKT